MTTLYEATEALKQLYLQMVQDNIKAQDEIKKSDVEVE